MVIWSGGWAQSHICAASHSGLIFADFHELINKDSGRLALNDFSMETSALKNKAEKHFALSIPNSYSTPLVH